MTAALESDSNKGSKAPGGKDGGDHNFVYEAGTNKKLTPSSVQARGELDNLKQGLVLWLTFDEGTGTTTIDLSGNNNHGTLINSPQWVDGKVGKALSFDGVDDYVQTNDPFANSSAFTISMWVNTNVINEGLYHGFSGKQEEACRKPGMWLTPGSNGGLHYFSWDSTCATAYSGILSSFFTGTNTWHYVVWTKSGTTYSFYRDGFLFSTSAAPVNFNTTATSYWIGRVNNYWNGLIDEVRIYNRALSDTEIKALYEATK